MHHCICDHTSLNMDILVHHLLIPLLVQATEIMHHHICDHAPSNMKALVYHLLIPLLSQATKIMQTNKTCIPCAHASRIDLASLFTFASKTDIALSLSVRTQIFLHGTCISGLTQRFLVCSRFFQCSCALDSLTVVCF